MDGRLGQSDGDGTGQMLSAMQKISGKQAMLNAATGQMLRQMLDGRGMQAGRGNGGGDDGEATRAANELARRQAQAQQNGIADELRKLAEKYGKASGGSLENKARELEEEARRIARQLEHPEPEVRERQDRFLSRMLETSLSMHRQGKGKEDRISQSAQHQGTLDVSRAGGEAFGDRDAFFLLRQRALGGNYPGKYRYSVKNYFDSLGAIYLKNK
jgi:hypothetical protein